MPIRVALFGLNRFGGSLAAALSSHDELHLTGYDSNSDTARIAQSRGLLKRVEWTMPNTVEGADLVLIAQPLAELKDTLAIIAPHLREGCVVASVGSLLQPAIQWAKETLPAGRYFVACHPTLNPAQLFDGVTGLDAARADLFTQGLWALAPAPNCAPEALKLLGDVATLVGAVAYFVDPAEHDGVVGGAEALPTLLAWALMLTATMSPGWPELRKMADRNFATATVALTDPAELALNRENVLRHLDSAISELKELRELIATSHADALTTALGDAQAQRVKWLTERQKGDWDAQEKTKLDVPGVGDTVGRMFMGNLFNRLKGDKKE